MPYAVHLQRLDSVPLAVIRRQVSASQISSAVRECCGLVWSALRALETPGGRHVAVYLDNSIRVEIGAELQGPFADAGDVVRSATPAGLVACNANHHTLAGPNWEIYGHWQPEWNDDPSRIRTDVHYLLSS